MPRRNIQPVSVAGIEFPAMLDETQTFTSDIPEYPVETGFVISDNITLQPMELPLTLLLSDTPLTWRGRVRSMSEAESMLKELYFSKTPFIVVTPSGTFESMGITSMQIKRSSENGYNKEVSLSLKQINVTATKTASIPDSYGKSGATGANAGTASTSAGSTSTGGGSSGGGSGGSGSSGGSSSGKQSSGSILYNVASSAGLI
ncbi:phage baseplate protein [Intestinimonas butyriciproducens]|uniref:phage baseplate protein n=1 Tax=Intestinimonas butyriciproducens TaxID=1297617 RepID=UPI001AB05E8B|nr:hypothetical protein [Intestinimonas butyriciproducens]MBO3281124.1 hypothetical protein [Intestinimonas butyriciproducens]